MIKSLKVRLYPTKEQEHLILKHAGCCRFIYNYMLNFQIERREEGKKYLSYFDMSKHITELRCDVSYSWLNDVSYTSLQRVCKDLDNAYQNFFAKRAKFPRFKSKKKCKLSFPVDSARIWCDENNYAHIIKIGKVKYKTDLNIPLGRKQKIMLPRIINKNGLWYLVFCVECENQVSTLNNFNMGIDLGIKESAVIAYSDRKLVFHNINKSKTIRELNEKVRKLQRSIFRKYECNKQGKKFVKTKNIEKEEHKLLKLRTRIANIQNNYIHQSTHFIVELLPRTIIMEDLNIKGMMKNKYLSKSVQEQCFGEWIRQIKYKSEYKGIEFIQVDRFYPSSKTCHNCGSVNRNLKLKDRIFICPECGYKEDRDFNAALNLMSYKN